MTKLENVLKRRENIIISGNIGSGKSTRVMFPIIDKLIDNGESLIISDINEKSLKTFYNKLKDNNYNIKIINFRKDTETEFFNLLTIPYNLYKNGKVNESMDILDAIGEHIITSKSAADPFWDNSAKSLFIGICIALFNDGKENEINLNSVMEIIRLFEVENYAKEYFESKKDIKEIFLNVESILYAPRETRGGIISVLRQKLGLITSRESLSNVLSNNTIDIDELKNKKSAIFIEMPDRMTFYSMLKNATIRELYECLKGIDNKYNFILDYADNDKDLDYMLNNISDNYKFYLVTRSFENIKEMCGKYVKNITLLINVDDDITISNYKDEESLEIESIEIDNCTDIKYPVLSVRDLCIFDAKDFVEKNKVVKKSVSTEELIARIDKKIQEIEELESKEGQ